VGGVLLLADARGEWRRPLRAGDVGRLHGCCGARTGEVESALAPSPQLQIGHRQQAGVLEGAVQVSSLDRNVEALAYGVEGRRRTRPVLAGEQQRVDEALLRKDRAPQKLKFGVEEDAIELGVVRDDRILAEEFHQPVDHVRVRELRLGAQHFVGDPGDAHGCFADRAAGVDVDLEFAARGQVVDQLDAADLYDTIALFGIEPGGFGVEDDFSHASVDSPVSASVSPRLSARIRDRRASRIASTWASA